MMHWKPRLLYLFVPALLALAACGDSGDGASNGSEADGQPEGDQTPVREETSGEFTALSYNVAGLPQEVSTVNPEKNIPLISPLLNDYDIVLTQEDFDWWQPSLDELDFSNYHSRLRAEVDHPYQSERHPGPEAVGIDVATDRPALAVGDGLGILSRFPFDRFRRVPWESCGESSADCMAMKGFASARIEIASGLIVDVYDLHADAGGEDSDIAARSDGFDQLAAYIEERSEGLAVILAGDTNLHTDPNSNDPQDAEDARLWTAFLERTGLVDVCDALQCSEPGRIDKFAFRSGGGIELEPLSWMFESEKFRDAEGQPLSDHDALAVTWRWSTSTE